MRRKCVISTRCYTKISVVVSKLQTWDQTQDWKLRFDFMQKNIDSCSWIVEIGQNWLFEFYANWMWITMMVGPKNVSKTFDNLLATNILILHRNSNFDSKKLYIHSVKNCKFFAHIALPKNAVDLTRLKNLKNVGTTSTSRDMQWCRILWQCKIIDGRVI